MNALPLDPQRLDVADFARRAQVLEGAWPMSALSRLADLHIADAAPSAQAHWQVQGEARPVKGGEPEIWLHLQAQAEVALCCQRCLGPVLTPVELDLSLRFVQGEEQAAALDAESEDDVLALQRWTDLSELVEDELLLALPLVPRHEECPEPLPFAAEPELDEAQEAEAAPHPFASLARLKKSAS